MLIDEEAGSYRGVRLGDTAGDVEDAFGRGAPITLMTGGPATPLGLEPWEYHGPQAISGPIADDDSEVLGLRYPKGVVSIDNDRVIVIETMEAGATTARGVAIGDPLDKGSGEVLGAGMRNDDDWRACQGRLGYRYIWFGGDPISVIAIGTASLKGL